MTYINLLPQEDRRKQLDYRHWLLIAGVLIGVIFCASLYIALQFELDQLYAEYDGLEDQMAMTQPTLGKVKKLEAELEQWQQRLHAAQGMDQTSDVAQLMVGISHLIPPQVSLHRLTQSQKELVVEGESADYHGIAAFMDALEGSERFTVVELVSSYLSQDDSGFIGFRILGKF
jgi:Tfp pilus assembly protein PilN